MSKKRRIASVKDELLEKSKESMLAAVQIFNNPNIHFKSESFIVLIVISWTYLLHAYYREQKIEYRYFDQAGQRKRFHRTKNGAYKYWELERCLTDDNCPVDKTMKANLFFLIGLRHEIEHQMTSRIDDLLSARFQACCLNYNSSLKSLFPKIESIDSYLSFSLQFSSLNQKHIDQLKDYKDLPRNISTFIKDYDENVTDADFNDSKYSYRVLFVPKTANRKGQADKVIEFVDPKSDIAKGLSKEYWAVKDREKTKLSATQVVEAIQKSGISDFNMHKHTLLWRKYDAKNPNKGYGTMVVNYWYWYENWVTFLLEELSDF
jgi:hypothetical protein